MEDIKKLVSEIKVLSNEMFQKRKVILEFIFKKVKEDLDRTLEYDNYAIVDDDRLYFCDKKRQIFFAITPDLYDYAVEADYSDIPSDDDEAGQKLEDDCEYLTKLLKEICE